MKLAESSKARPFWGSSLAIEVGDFSPSVAAFDARGVFLALGGYGWGRVLASDGSVVWEGLLLPEGASDDAGVVTVAAVASSGRWALFATNFHTGGSGSRGLFLVDTVRGEAVELDADVRREFLAASFSADERHVVVATSGGKCAFEISSRGEVRPPRGGLELRRPLDQDEETLWTSGDGRSRYVLDGAVLRLVEGKRSTDLRWPKHLELDPEQPVRAFAVTTDGSRLVVANERGGMASELFVLSSQPPAVGKARRRVKLGPIAAASKPAAASAPPPVAARPSPKPKPPAPKPPLGHEKPAKDASPKLSKLARCSANARAHEAGGDLWAAAIWAAGACAARGGAAASAELDRLAAKLGADGGELDGPLVEVFTLFEETPHALWRALARLQDRAPERKEELALYAVCTWLVDEGDNERHAFELLDLAARRFESSPTVWFCRVLMTNTRSSGPTLSCYRKLVACLERPDRSPHEASFERFAVHSRGANLSLRGTAARVTCMRLLSAGKSRDVLEIVTGALADAAQPTPTDRVLLLQKRAEALTKLERPAEAAEALREALALHARQKLEVYFPRTLHLGHVAGLLAAAGRFDEAVAGFTDLWREAPDEARRLWRKSARVSGEPRFAVVLSALSAPPPREAIEAELAQAKRLLRKGKTGEACDLTTRAVAGAFLRDDAALLAQALVVHSETLPNVHADPDVALPPLRRALTLTKDPALRRTIQRALCAVP